MKNRGGGTSISRRVLLICIVLAVICQVGLCVNAKQRTKQKKSERHIESLAQEESKELQNNIEKTDDESSNSMISQNEQQENGTKNVRKSEENNSSAAANELEKGGVISLVQKQVSILKQVYLNYYSKLTLHLGSQKDIYVSIAATVLIFTIVFITLSSNKQDFPFLRNLDLQQTFQTKAHLDKQRRQKEQDEQFYNSYNLSNSVNNKSLNNSEADSYLSASDYKLERQQVDILNTLEWQRMKDRAQKYAAFENNPLNQDYKMKSKQCNQKRGNKIDDTIDFNENNFDINDLLKELENQSFSANKSACNSSQTSNILPQTNTIVH